MADISRGASSSTTTMYATPISDTAVAAEAVIVDNSK